MDELPVSCTQHVPMDSFLFLSHIARIYKDKMQDSKINFSHLLFNVRPVTVFPMQQGDAAWGFDFAWLFRFAANPS